MDREFGLVAPVSTGDNHGRTAGNRTYRVGDVLHGSLFVAKATQEITMNVREFLAELKKQHPQGWLDLEIMMSDGVEVVSIEAGRETVWLSDCSKEPELDEKEVLKKGYF